MKQIQTMLSCRLPTHRPTVGRDSAGARAGGRGPKRPSTTASVPSRLASAVSPELAHTLSLLAPRGRFVADVAGSGDYVVATFAVFPTLSRARLLLPVNSRGAAAGLLRLRGAWRQSWRAHLAYELATWGLISGALQPLLRNRVRILSHDVRQGHAAEYLPQFLGSVLGQPATIGAALRQLDPHQSQVFYALSPEGTPLAFAKVGWNDHTQSLLAAEADVLRNWDRAPSHVVEPPNLIYFGLWNGLALLVTAPLDVDLSVHSSRDDPQVGAIRAIAESGRRSRERVGTSRYWHQTRLRVDEVSTHQSLGDQTLLASAYARLGASLFDRSLEFGAWHGDWLPWNFSPQRGRLLVWDWEYSSSMVPLGFDVLHFFYGVAFYALRTDVADAFRASRIRSRPFLSELGIPPHEADTVYALFVLETVLRRLDIRTRGGGRDDARVFPGIYRVLADAVDRVAGAPGRPPGIPQGADGTRNDKEVTS